MEQEVKVLRVTNSKLSGEVNPSDHDGDTDD